MTMNFDEAIEYIIKEKGIDILSNKQFVALLKDLSPNDKMSSLVSSFVNSGIGICFVEMYKDNNTTLDEIKYIQGGVAIDKDNIILDNLTEQLLMSLFPVFIIYIYIHIYTHSSVLAWRILGMGEPGGIASMWSHRVGRA